MLGNLVTKGSNGKSGLEKEVLKRSKSLPKARITKAKIDGLKGDRIQTKAVSTPTTFVQEGRLQEVPQDQEIGPFRGSSSILRFLPKMATKIKPKKTH